MYKIHNVPAELQELPQWVVWRYELSEQGKQTKVPYSVNGRRASSTDSSTWGHFRVALQKCQEWNAAGVGFVLSVNDPYTIIDLDNKPEKPATEEQLERHSKILEAFQSYTEISTSGTGCHIIVRGKIPHGRNKDNVEVYSSSRFMAMTGNVVRNLPIADYQDLLDLLYAEMEPHERTDLVQVDSHLTDAEVVEMAMRAVNGDKFNELCKGDWQSLGYQSQSEADLALLSILAYYTRDNEQVRRIFRMSNLGKREKAIKNNTYLNFNLEKIRAKEAPLVDLSMLSFNPPAPEPSPVYQHPATILEAAPIEYPVASSEPDLTVPPGIIGEIAQYIYMSAVRPVKELSMMAALAMTAGIVGRAYTISGTGLNQYLVVLAGTGSGKEGMQSGIDNLFAHTRFKVPMIDTFMGPGVFGSGQGFNKLLQDQPCFVSVLSEFAHMLKGLLSPRASEHQIMLKGNLLKAFSSSGPHQVYKGTVYSNKENNIKSIRAPNVSFLGECTPEIFFSTLNEEHAADGFIPRLLITEYVGGRPPLNLNANFTPPAELVQRIADLATASIQVQSQNQTVQIQQDQDAYRMLLDYCGEIDARMNALPEGAVKHVLNRSHLKALKLAGLLAVGVNPWQPVVTAELAQWAIAFVNRADQIVTTRFESGEVGEGDTLFEPVIRKAIEFYRALSPEARVRNAKCPKAVADQPLVPFASIRDYCKRREPFKSHKLGYSRALEIALADLVAAGILLEVPPAQLPMATNGSKIKVYGLGEGYW